MTSLKTFFSNFKTDKSIKFTLYIIFYFLLLILFKSYSKPIFEILSAPVIFFFYPFEIEWREGTVWLHVLAQLKGINIYNHNVVAYMNMDHGPVDPLLKYYIAKFLPSLSPWQNARFFVIALPIALVLSSSLLLCKGLKKYWLLGPIYGISIYIALMSANNSGVFLLFARSDPTSHFIGVAYLCSLFLFFKKVKYPYFLALLSGFLFALTYLATWRSIPFLVSAFLITCSACYQKFSSKKIYVLSVLSFIVGIFSIFIIFIIGIFHNDLVLFFQHFYSIFVDINKSHFRLGGFQVNSGALSRDNISAILSASNKIYGLGHHFIIILLPIFAIWIVHFICKIKNINPIIQFWQAISITAFYALSFFGFSLAFIFQGVYGGSLAYFSYMYLLAWFTFAWLVQQLPIFKTESILIFSSLVIILSLNHGGGSEVRIGAAQVFNLTDSARAFDYELSRLRKQYYFVSDNYHFFKRNYDRDVIDMGDYSWEIAQNGSFGPEFTKTAYVYINSLTINKPEIVLTSGVSSKPLLDLVKTGYECIACGIKGYYGGDELSRFNLYARKDLPVKELKERFSAFSSVK